jgi:porphobilinogen synthase
MYKFHPLRKDQETRDKNAEVYPLLASDFIYPYFIIEGKRIRKPIKKLTGINRFTIDELLLDIKLTLALGIDKILLFGVIDDDKKDDSGSAAYAYNNLISRAVKAIKNKFPSVVIFTDVCLCGYTSHGHCGLIKGTSIENDSTLPLLAKMAVSHADAGADFVAPSAMMDGQVEAIRLLLNNEGFHKTKILSYSAKYASSFYGPFREAAKSTPSFGDRKSYQMDYRTVKQPIDSVMTAINEGADWVMVKPAHTYLDIIQRVKEKFPSTILAAYQVSGEYMMIISASEAGYMNLRFAMTEALTAIKRAGADYIISYYAKEYCVST